MFATDAADQRRTTRRAAHSTAAITQATHQALGAHAPSSPLPADAHGLAAQGLMHSRPAIRATGLVVDLLGPVPATVDQDHHLRSRCRWRSISSSEPSGPAPSSSTVCRCRRHHRHLDLGRVALPGHRDRPRITTRRRVGDGRVHRPAHRIQDDPVTVTTTAMLAQRCRGELLRVAQDRAHPPSILGDPRARAPIRLRLHRGVLQPAAAALVARLPHASRSGVVRVGWIAIRGEDDGR